MGSDIQKHNRVAVACVLCEDRTLDGCLANPFFKTHPHFFASLKIFPCNFTLIFYLCNHSNPEHETMQIVKSHNFAMFTHHSRHRCGLRVDSAQTSTITPLRRRIRISRRRRRPGRVYDA